MTPPTRTRPVNSRALLRSVLSRSHPRRLACALLGIDLLVVVAAAFVIRAVAPDLSGLTASLIVTGILTVLVTGLVWRISGFREAGFVGPGNWRNLHLLAVPAALAIVPVLGGVREVDTGLLITLLVGYALTGFMEEAMWRGLVLRILQPTGALQAVLFSSVLFGASHLANVLFRESAALVVAQAVGAVCFGVGYAALRLRIHTIWPLMALHMLTDLLAAIGALPKVPILVGQDVVLLIFGLLLLRRRIPAAVDAIWRG